MIGTTRVRVIPGWRQNDFNTSPRRHRPMFKLHTMQVFYMWPPLWHCHTWWKKQCIQYTGSPPRRIDIFWAGIIPFYCAYTSSRFLVKVNRNWAIFSLLIGSRALPHTSIYCVYFMLVLYVGLDTKDAINKAIFSRLRNRFPTLLFLSKFRRTFLLRRKSGWEGVLPASKNQNHKSES